MREPVWVARRYAGLVGAGTGPTSGYGYGCLAATLGVQVRGDADVNLQKAHLVRYVSVPMAPRPRPRLYMSCVLS